MLTYVNDSFLRIWGFDDGSQVIGRSMTPEMKGTELEGRIKTIRHGTPVHFISGYTSNVIAHHGVLEEGVHFLQRPFGARDLAAAIRRTLLNSR